MIYEQGQDSWGAYSPDLPGCTAVASSRDEVERLMHEAVESHVDVLRSEGLPVCRSQRALPAAWRRSRSVQLHQSARLELRGAQSTVPKTTKGGPLDRPSPMRTLQVALRGINNPACGGACNQAEVLDYGP